MFCRGSRSGASQNVSSQTASSVATKFGLSHDLVTTEDVDADEETMTKLGLNHQA